MRLHVLYMLTSTWGQLVMRAAANMLTEIVLPNRRGVEMRISCARCSHPLLRTFIYLLQLKKGGVAKAYFVVVLGKSARSGSRPENASAWFQKVFVEQSVVVGPIPAAAIKLCQCVATVLHFLKRRLLFVASHVALRVM